MTTILMAKKNRTLYVAADSQVTDNGVIFSNNYSKIKTIGNLTYTFCGDLNVSSLATLIITHLGDRLDLLRLQSYLMDNSDRFEKTKTDAETYIFKTQNGLLVGIYHIEFEALGLSYYEPEEFSDLCASGSGSLYALGAFKALDASTNIRERIKKAIEVASEIDFYTNDNVDVVSFKY